MKKQFINDIRTFVLLIFAILLFNSILIVYLTNITHATRDSLSCVIFCCVFGGFVLLSLIALLMSLEIIIISEDSIKCLKLHKCTKILYNEIKSIQETDKFGFGAGGVERVWEIMSFSKQTIYIIKSNKRKTIVDKVQEKIKSRN